MPQGNFLWLFTVGKSWAQRAARSEHILLQVPNLVSPLGHDSECILQEGNHDEKTPNCRQMGFQWLGVDLDVVLDSLANRS